MKAPHCMSMALISAALLTGCRSFESDWKTAEGQTRRTGTTAITGAWVGTWQNTNNTHSGPLRAVVWRVDDTRYRARFHAGWGRHSGSFRMTLKGQTTEDTFHFKGVKRILGIPIRTDGVVGSQTFRANYTSMFDQGTFTLERPMQAGQ